MSKKQKAPEAPEKPGPADYEVTKEQVAVLLEAQGGIVEADRELRSAKRTYMTVVRTVLAGHGVGRIADSEIELDADAGLIRVTPRGGDEE